MSHHRLNNKIAQGIVEGGLFDEKRKNETLFCALAFRNRDFKVHRDSARHTRWCRAYSFDIGLKKSLAYGVPMWFIKRHKGLLVATSIWIKKYTWSSHHADPYAGYLLHNFIEDLQDFQINGQVISSHMSLDAHNEFKREMLYPSHFSSSNSMGIVPQDVYATWVAIRNRFLAIYGLDCKMCEKHKKNKKPICKDLSKYATDICADCLKKFCKLSMKTREIEYERMVS